MDSKPVQMDLFSYQSIPQTGKVKIQQGLRKKIQGIVELSEEEKRTMLENRVEEMEYLAIDTKNKVIQLDAELKEAKGKLTAMDIELKTTKDKLVVLEDKPKGA